MLTRVNYTCLPNCRVQIFSIKKPKTRVKTANQTSTAKNPFAGFAGLSTAASFPSFTSFGSNANQPLPNPFASLKNTVEDTSNGTKIIGADTSSASSTTHTVTPSTPFGFFR